MAGSLKRPAFKFIPLHNYSASKYKSITKYEKLSLLRTKGRHYNNTTNSSSGSCHQKPHQLHQLLKQLKYCQSLSLGKLLLLLPSSLTSFSNDSCRTATKNEKYYKNLITKTASAIKYVQQQVQQYHQQNQQQKQEYQQHQLQLLQILNKVFKSSKFHKNLLNRKKLQKTQLREKQFYGKNPFYEKTF